jgi:hypothetical protein
MPLPSNQKAMIRQDLQDSQASRYSALSTFYFCPLPVNPVDPVGYLSPDIRLRFAKKTGIRKILGKPL